jgi:uncharacterized membrane protein YqjE
MTGLVNSVRKLFDNGLAAVQNRIELFRLELREEKWRFIETVVLVLAAFFLGMMAVLLLTAAVLFSFKDESRAYVAAAFCVSYIVGAVWGFYCVKRRLKGQPPPFSETAAQLQKDREWLDSLE